MNGGAQRLPRGGCIDRTRPLEFAFDGRSYRGFAGDTLASALLANGVRVVARSFKFHRPRGVFAAGAEEPNAIVSLGEGARRESNVRATLQPLYQGLVAQAQNCWPSLRHDLGRVADLLHPLLAAGFYNKTFLWPGWWLYEPLLRRAAGLGRANAEPDPDRYEARNASCDVLVVGAGPSGLLAALAAAQTGARVLLVEQDVEPGGSLLWERAAAGFDAEGFARALLERVQAEPRIALLTHTTAAGAYDHGVFLLHQRVAAVGAAAAGECCERLWRIRARETILATGAIEQPLVFAGNDRPGVMLAGAVRQYLRRFAVLPARRWVVATSDDAAYATARELIVAGAPPAAVIDLRPRVAEELAHGLRERGVPLLAGAALHDTRGGQSLRAVRVHTAEGRLETFECDGLAVSGGHNPTLHLLCQAGGKLRFDERLGALVPRQVPAGLAVAGAASGERDPGIAWPQAFAAGLQAARRAGFQGATEMPPLELPAPRASGDRSIPGGAQAPDGASGRIAGRRRARAWVDLAHDVTLQDLDIAVRENYVSVEHLKRYTTNGMAVDQGKTSNLNALVALAWATDRSIDATGTTTYRPPYMPVTLGALAAGRVGRFYRPERRLPSHAEQLALGAKLEDYGGWLRPVAYPRPGESEHAAIQREARAVREGVGLFEASPLGKLLVRGPDAAEFLDRIYLNDMLSLGVGRVRYGLMLNEKGVIIDDGVCARLGEQEFWVSTTSGAAERIAGWLDEWLQCEWVSARVVVTPVTAQWATLTVAGPRAREVLQRLPCDIDLAREAFPHMQVRSGTLCGVSCRILRVSFSGEASFEVNVPADYGCALWRRLMEAGRDAGITPYGIEAVQVLRTEKGYLHVGADTDGTTVPDDVGFGAVAAKKPRDFIGRRSLSLPENTRPDRLQLVGLRATAPGQVLEAGAHLVARADTRSSRRTEGYVTSACLSPMLGEYVALGLLERGRARHGETVVLFSQGRESFARVVAPVFHDPEGRRLHA